jgi:flagellar hook protein FlgE
LIDLRRFDGSTYNKVFDFTAGQTATLQFTGKKGGRSLATKDLTIDQNTTVQQLMDFMTQAMGIQPLGQDQSTGLTPGGHVQSGHILMVGNNGVDNAVDVDLSGMSLVRQDASTQTVNMGWGVYDEAPNQPATAKGESAVTDFIVYDSLGIPMSVRLTAVLESRSSLQTTYRWFADSPDNQPESGVSIAVGTGLIQFDGTGNYKPGLVNRVEIRRSQVASVDPLVFDLDFSQISGLAAAHSSIAVSRQDGSAPGVLTSFIIGEDGRIRGVFSNGITRDLGQIRLARFGNAAGLEQKGENMFAAGINSGLPVEGNPNEQGIGSIIAGAQELSNTDIGGNLIDLILASTMYRGNTRVVTTVQQMLDELLALRR